MVQGSQSLTLVANWLNLWDISLLKDTVILAAFSVSPLLLAKPLKVDNGKQLLVEVTKDTFGATALIITYINLVPLPYLAELVLQAFATFLVAGIELGKRRSTLHSTVATLRKIQAALSLSLLTWVTVQVLQSYDTHAWMQQLKSLLFSAYLPLTMIPFAYGLGIVAGIESKLALLAVHNKRTKSSVKLAMVIGFRARLLYVNALRGQWLIDLANSGGYREARKIMARYRQTAQANLRFNHERGRQLRRFAGMKGRDGEGRWIDRREFYETKRALNYIYSSELGLYRNHDQHYLDNQDAVFPINGFEGLPDPHDIHLVIREDGQAWYAWRLTVGGCHLAIGGSSNMTVPWCYSGELAPDSFPGENASGWLVQGSGTESEDWAFDDSPAPSC